MTGKTCWAYVDFKAAWVVVWGHMVQGKSVYPTEYNISVHLRKIWAHRDSHLHSWCCPSHISIIYWNNPFYRSVNASAIEFFLTFHAGGPGSRGAGDLPGETGALDGLRALLNLVLIAAAVDGHHLTCALLHLIRHWKTEQIHPQLPWFSSNVVLTHTHTHSHGNHSVQLELLIIFATQGSSTDHHLLGYWWRQVHVTLTVVIPHLRAVQSFKHLGRYVCQCAMEEGMRNIHPYWRFSFSFLLPAAGQADVAGPKLFVCLPEALLPFSPRAQQTVLVTLQLISLSIAAEKNRG